MPHLPDSLPQILPLDPFLQVVILIIIQQFYLMHMFSLLVVLLDHLVEDFQPERVQLIL